MVFLWSILRSIQILPAINVNYRGGVDVCTVYTLSPHCIYKHFYHRRQRNSKVNASESSEELQARQLWDVKAKAAKHQAKSGRKASVSLYPF